MIDVAYGPPLSLVIRSYLAEVERWNQSRGPWVDPDRAGQEMRKRENIEFMCWLASQPLVRGERG